jgi:hypothetical protein
LPKCDAPTQAHKWRHSQAFNLRKTHLVPLRQQTKIIAADASGEKIVPLAYFTQLVRYFHRKHIRHRLSGGTRKQRRPHNVQRRSQGYLFGFGNFRSCWSWLRQRDSSPH